MEHDGGRVTIGEVGERSGVSAATLRYYEELGLIAPVARRGLTRLYEAPAIFERLEMIRLTSAIGFTLQEAKALLSRARDREAFVPLAEAKLAALEQRRRDLATAAKMLRHALVCNCGDVTECLAASSPPPNLLRSATRARRFER
ncbi:MerR family transcriptional regulator [Vulcanimicrobium alpinum]|uniref:MerR family transcriptional regulator n=1 Tax=Vulcanimicrobium alpinum TaxID=3016050 RepID=A0AAN1XUN6_UNVUL|nr:MerR family transcriptional regulator [Vulcanimicrobium alpinum]BDE05791.1 MerR family transcriptional regulator [Vulcanimicrobium alpinum]